VRRVLFRLPPERAHGVVMAGLAATGRSALLTHLLRAAYGLEDPRLVVHAFGLRFPSPVGLAAGLDKDGVAVPALAAIGFGHLELGSVTARAQPGNPRPRLFRLLEDEALINRMGFNNAGSDALARRIARLRRAGSVHVPLGINVGKSRDVPVEDAVDDYERALRDVWQVADYLAVNVSSPNTPGLRSLQACGPLDTLLALVGRLQRELGNKPVLLKLAPDLADEPLLDAARIAERHGLAGIVATNTTTRREGLRSPHATEAGGLSGRPLAARSLQVLELLRAHTRLPIVSVGGIASGADVVARLAAGASLVQVYPGFIYRGPALLRELNEAVLRALERAGLRDVAELTARGLPAPSPRQAPPSVR
jgi:dihydroorotate dehydrogenase